MRWRIPDDVNVVMGHTRLTTQGNAKHNYNNHPFYGSATNFFIDIQAALFEILYQLLLSAISCKLRPGHVNRNSFGITEAVQEEDRSAGEPWRIYGDKRWPAQAVQRSEAE